MDEHIDHSRRAASATLLGAGAALALTGCGRSAPDPLEVGDIAAIDRTRVARIAQPRSTAEVAALLRDSNGAVSVGGACYSMGGQVSAADSLHLDLRSLIGVVRLDREAQRIRVRSGMRWRDVQDQIDPHDLSIAVMQSYSNFSVGGSISVNCHGRYLHAGPIAHTVQALQLVDAQGSVHELDRQRDPALFAAAIGGYGGLGVITEAELSLAHNDLLERHVQQLPLADYPAFFAERIASDPLAVMHNADLMPPRFDQPLAVTWRRSIATPTEPRRLLPRGQDYARERTLIWAASELPMGPWLRERYQTEPLLHTPAVMRRNCPAWMRMRWSRARGACPPSCCRNTSCRWRHSPHSHRTWQRSCDAMRSTRSTSPSATRLPTRWRCCAGRRNRCSRSCCTTSSAVGWPRTVTRRYGRGN
ncbi:FAD-binding oxidoreductase [Xanthomonas sp. PPL568]|nr:FAD-binding oxidoreductase [Xanthomonas indica]MCI2245559.1 FAD-binding oxidoreductase [Xanthomonas indica]